MTPIQRAARALHKRYVEERIRNGVKPSDLPSWDDLDVDGVYYFTAPVRDVLAAIREPSEAMVQAMDQADYECSEDIGMIQLGIDPAIPFRAGIDALLEEGK